jgi:septal ring factor EnvC (AmiA/AmiB activator)
MGQAIFCGMNGLSLPSTLFRQEKKWYDIPERRTIHQINRLFREGNQMKKNLTVPIIAILAILVIVMSSLYFTKKPEPAPAAEPDTAQIDALNAEIKEKTKRIDALTAEVSEKTEMISKLNEDIGKQAEEIDALKTEIAEKAKQIDQVLNVLQPEATETTETTETIETNETTETTETTEASETTETEPTEENN